MKRKKKKSFNVSDELSKAMKMHQNGNLSQAKTLYKKIIRHTPTHSHALHMLGVLYTQAGEFDRAIDLMRKSFKFAPNRSDFLFNLARACHDGGRLEDAIATYQKYLELVPDDPEALHWLALAWQTKKEFGKAVIFYKRALEKSPERIDSLNSLGLTYHEQGDFNQAIKYYEKALNHYPNDFIVLTNLAVTYRELEKTEEAATCIRKVLTLKPDYEVAHYNMGNILKDQGKLDEAVARYRQALSFKPDYIDAHYNMGNILKDQGKLDEAVACFRQVLVLKPDYVDAYSNLLFTLTHLQDQSNSNYLDESHNYGRQISNRVSGKYSSWNCSARPQVLRVGMLSGDFWSHPAGYFLENILSQIDSTKIDLVAFPTNTREDELTARIRPRFAGWNPASDMGDKEAARLIYDAGIHILLDLSGHTRHNRLPVFAWKPAPVQATWLGYWASTGITEMDYIIVDPISVPESQQGQFTEKTWTLPDLRYCFSPPQVGHELLTSPLPAMQNGYITFGCFQAFRKINDEVLSSWAKILQALPQARILLMNKALNSSEICERLQRRLTRCEIDPDRVTLEKTVPRIEYLAKYDLVDIMLDTHPFTGGTTTCEALWMGVPTVTLAGYTMIARQGASILECAGLTDWIGSNSGEYEAKAVANSADLNKLAQLRSQLRQKVLGSPLFDAKRFASNFETAMWEMWEHYQSSSNNFPG